jgi:hypothetical protein
MSIAQTYFLAHKARAKLSSEAARPDHNLRLLVGHANLLDSLMLDLAEAEREQELWFHQSVRGASSPPAEERHVQWADNVAVEEPEHDWRAEDAESSDSDSDSDDSFDEEEDDEDIEMADAISLRRIPSHPNKSFQHHYNDEEDFDMDDEEDYEQLSLQRISSHSNTSPSSPPELDSDSDESTEDEPMPPSPPTTAMPTFEDSKNSQSTPPSPTSVDKDSFYEEGYYLPPRNSARLVTAISVY